MEILEIVYSKRNIINTGEGICHPLTWCRCLYIVEKQLLIFYRLEVLDYSQSETILTALDVKPFK